VQTLGLIFFEVCSSLAPNASGSDCEQPIIAEVRRPEAYSGCVLMAPRTFTPSSFAER
jgi:hypothetical protein